MAERQYRIVFTASEADKKRFAYLYGWFVAGGNATERKGIEGARREATVLDKLWAISDRPRQLPDHVEGIRELADLTDSTLVLTQPEYDLVKRYVESVSPRTEASRMFVDLVDWWAGLKPESE